MDVPTLQSLYAGSDPWEVLVSFVQVRDSLNAEKCAAEAVVAAQAAELAAQTGQVEVLKAQIESLKSQLELKGAVLEEYKSAVLAQLRTLLKE
jgi:cell division protein FtsB